MAKVPDQIAVNYAAFSASLPGVLESNIAAIRGNEKLIESYCRVASINSLKRDVIEPNLNKSASRFFFEAHNDALVSHVNASFGSWRTALQALRSFIENVLSAIYFADHPIEHIKWLKGEFRISPKELREYCTTHPSLMGIDKHVKISDLLDKEYSTLSKAVHASNDLFRMTDEGGENNIGAPDVAELGKWATRERASIELCTILLVAYLKDYLDGAKLPNVRKSLGYSIGKKARTAIKTTFSVTIPDPL